MKNTEIIDNALIELKLDPLLEVATVPEWNRRGFSIKKGEHAIFKTKIWKPLDRKEENSTANTKEENEKKMILVPAAFFSKEQVEKRV